MYIIVILQGSNLRQAFMDMTVFILKYLCIYYLADLRVCSLNCSFLGIHINCGEKVGSEVIILILQVE